MSSSSSTSELPIPQSIDEKIRYSTLLKEEGNALFKQQQYKKAIRKYKFISLYLTGLENPYESLTSPSKHVKIKEQTKRHIEQLLVTADLNLAQCYLKIHPTPDYQKVKEYTSKVLSKDSNNIKALVRRAQAHLGLKDVENAKQDLLKIESLDANASSDPLVQQLYQRLSVMDMEQTQRQKQVYRRMFGQ